MFRRRKSEAPSTPCRVTVRLLYTDDTRTTPYKWAVNCTCGYGGLSWSWSRQYDMETSNLSRDEWIRDNGMPEGGALAMALEHVGLAPKQTWVPLFPPLAH